MRSLSTLLLVTLLAGAVGCGSDDDSSGSSDITVDSGTTSGQADAGEADTSAPDTAEADTDAPDTGTPDTDMADSDMADTDTPEDTGMADTDIPEDTGVEDTGVGDTSMADTEVDTGEEDTGEEDTGVADVEPDVVEVDACEPNPCEREAMDAFCEGDTIVTPDTAGTCADEAGEAVCTYGATEVDCTESGQVCDAGQCVAAARAPVAGELIVTEVMYLPSGDLGASAEWFELLNLTDEPLSLEGCELRDSATSSTIGSRVVVAPGEFALMVRSANMTANGGLEADATFDFSLGVVDSVGLWCDGAEIHSVAWDLEEWPQIGAAQSLSLSSDVIDPAVASESYRWCPGEDEYTDGVAPAHRGTPGAANPICVDVTVDWCRIEEPGVFVTTIGEDVAVTGLLREPGITGDAGLGEERLTVELGWGPDGSDPATDDSWVWTEVALEREEADIDIATGFFSAPPPGLYDYAFRATYPDGEWLYCDRGNDDPDLDGSADGYRPETAGQLTVEDTPSILEAMFAVDQVDTCTTRVECPYTVQDPDTNQSFEAEIIYTVNGQRFFAIDGAYIPGEGGHEPLEAGRTISCSVALLDAETGIPTGASVEVEPIPIVLAEPGACTPLDLCRGIDATGDIDSDGLCANLEEEAGSSDELADTDGDRLTDYQEVILFGSDPTLIDSDNGGTPDGKEAAFGTDPNVGEDDVQVSWMFLSSSTVGVTFEVGNRREPRTVRAIHMDSECERLAQEAGLIETRWRSDVLLEQIPPNPAQDDPQALRYVGEDSIPYRARLRTGPKLYRAVVSTSFVSARERLPEGGLASLGITRVAADRDALFASGPDAPIIHTETGARLPEDEPSEVWTATRNDGSVGNACWGAELEWAREWDLRQFLGMTAVYGDPRVEGGWIEAGDEPCSLGNNPFNQEYIERRVYCVEVDDRDGDRLSDTEEELLGTDPDNVDSDGDFISDGEEHWVLQSDPLGTDTDEDGYDDLREAYLCFSRFFNGFFLCDLPDAIDPNSRDTDGDSIEDNEDNEPLLGDRDYDGLSDLEEMELGTDEWEQDSDYDGTPDNIEVAQGTDPNNAEDGAGDYRMVYLSYGRYPANFAVENNAFETFDDPDVIEGVIGADTICNWERELLDLPWSQARAVLASEEADVPTRIPAAGATLLLNGQVVLPTTLGDALASGLGVGLVDEPTPVWTGANADGTWSGSDCNGWTSVSPDDSATIGDASAADTGWLNSGVGDCSGSRHILCVQVVDRDRDGLLDGEEEVLGTDPNNEDTDFDGLDDREELFVYGTDPLLEDTDEGGTPDYEEIQMGTDPNDINDDLPVYYVFVSDFGIRVSNIVDAGGGLEGADSICNDLAAEDELAGTYVAYLNTSTVNAHERILDDTPYLQTRGELFIQDREDLIEGRAGTNLLAANGFPGVSQQETWIGSAEANCQDWTSFDRADFATFGRFRSGNDWATGPEGELACNNSIVRLVCFQVSEDSPPSQ